VNPDTIGYVWTGEFDMNTLRVDREFLNPERKSCGLKNIRIRVDGAYDGTNYLPLSRGLRVPIAEHAPLASTHRELKHSLVR